MRQITAFILLLASASPALAEELPTPSDTPILTVSGAITRTNVGDTAVFDRPMLEALANVRFTTSTTWTNGTPEFTGVPLVDLLDAVGAEGTMLRAVALNDYGVEIPISDAVEGGPIVAYAMDGAAMSVRDKGPLWIVYPYDSTPDYQTEVIYSRSIWQLHEVEVLP